MLSDGEIYKIMNGMIKVLKYSDLYKYNNIDDLLGPYQQCMILYETKKNTGHWVCIFSYNGLLTFFDSYGFQYPNDELDFIDDKFIVQNKMYPDLLYRLLFQYDNIDHNDYPLQNMDPNITTCGYWCIARLYLKFLNNLQFKKLFDGIPDKDDFVVGLVHYHK